MILIANSEDEHRSAMRALEVINSLRRREPVTVPPMTEDRPWVRTRWAKPEYL
jgi:hypothetical protein